MSSKLRLVLAGLTAAALIGGVMVADPADAGKKKRKKAKVVKVHKGKKVKQVSKGGDAKAGNGGNGGSGGSSGNVYNTGNVNGGGASATPAEVGCILGAFDAAPGDTIDVADELDDFLIAAEACGASVAERLCLRNAASAPGDTTLLERAEVTGCIGAPAPGPGAGGSVFSGDAGDGGTGGDGGDAAGGTGGNNSNSSTRTVTSDDHSIDVDD